MLHFQKSEIEDEWGNAYEELIDNFSLTWRQDCDMICHMGMDNRFV